MWHQSEARTTPTVWNWSGKTVSPGAPRFVLHFSSPIFFFRPLRLFLAPTNCPLTARVSEDAQGQNKINTEKQSELAAKHSKQNELTPRQTEKIEAAKQTHRRYFNTLTDKQGQAKQNKCKRAEIRNCDFDP